MREDGRRKGDCGSEVDEVSGLDRRRAEKRGDR